MSGVVSLPGALAAAALSAVLLTGCGSASTPVAQPTATVQSALPLERFHYVAALTLSEEGPASGIGDIVVTTEGDVAGPDRHGFSYSIRRGDGVIERSVVVVGDDAWFREGGAPWTKTAPDDPRVAGLLVPAGEPGFLGGQAFRAVQENVRRLPSTKETVNGLVANHYRVGPAGRDFSGGVLADDRLLQGSWDLWLAEEGDWPVRLVASGTVLPELSILDQLDLRPPTSWELRIDISRPNDPTLVVVVPEEEDSPPR